MGLHCIALIDIYGTERVRKSSRVELSGREKEKKKNSTQLIWKVYINDNIIYRNEERERERYIEREKKRKMVLYYSI